MCFRIHCIFACEGIEVFQDYVNRSLHAYKLPENFSYKDVMTIYEDYQYPSYGQNYPEQLGIINYMNVLYLYQPQASCANSLRIC